MNAHHTKLKSAESTGTGTLIGAIITVLVLTIIGLCVWISKTKDKEPGKVIVVEEKVVLPKQFTVMPKGTEIITTKNFKGTIYWYTGVLEVGDFTPLLEVEPFKTRIDQNKLVPDGAIAFVLEGGPIVGEIYSIDFITKPKLLVD